MVRIVLILSLAVFLALSCDKEDRKNTYADQESRIDSYVSGLSSDYQVIYNGGAVRVIIDPAASSARMLQKGDSVYFHYSGYIFSGGKGSLFATNDSEVAEAAGFITDGNPFKIKYGSSALLEGLRLGLEGVQEGEHCYIIFSARYGYGNQIMANLPKLTPLLFEITVDKIF